MPKAATTTTTSRRTLLAAAAVLPLAALPAVALAGGSDAELLRLAGEFQRHHDRYLEHTLRHADWRGPWPAAVDTELTALVSINHGLAEQIADLHASTVAGLRAKAGVLLAFTGYTLDGDPMWTNHDDLLGWSIAREGSGIGL